MNHYTLTRGKHQVEEGKNFIEFWPKVRKSQTLRSQDTYLKRTWFGTYYYFKDWEKAN
jgi:hypothetical protein